MDNPTLYLWVSRLRFIDDFGISWTTEMSASPPIQDAAWQTFSAVVASREKDKQQADKQQADLLRTLLQLASTKMCSLHFRLDLDMTSGLLRPA